MIHGYGAWGMSDRKQVEPFIIFAFWMAFLFDMRIRKIAMSVPRTKHSYGYNYRPLEATYRGEEI